MADNGRALKWTGYGSLAHAYELPSPAQEPASPSQSYICSSPVIPQTPPLWGSPYSVASPLESASPMTPMSSFALWSPSAFHSPQLDSSKPPHFSNYSTTSSPSFVGFERPLSPSASPYAPLTPPIGRQVRPGPLVPQRAYSAPFSAGNKPMQVNFRLSSGESGVPMRLLQEGGAMDLPVEGADTSPFSESVASTITLRIWWPGYVQYSRRMTMRKGNRLLTHQELAVAVVEVFKQFIEEAREAPSDPGQAKWRIGRGHITVNDLVLLRVYQVSQGSWQADVRLEAER